MSELDLQQSERFIAALDQKSAVAMVASDLLAEVKRLRLLLHMPLHPCSPEAVAFALGVAPRTVRMWIDQKRLKATAELKIHSASLLEFLRSHGWDTDSLTKVQQRLNEGAPT